MRQFDINKVEKEKSVSSADGRTRRSRKNSFLAYLLGILIGVVVISGLLQIQNKGTTKETPIKEGVASEERQSAEEAVKEEPTAAPAPTAAPVPESTPVPAAQPAIDKIKLTIQVLNGNGVRGDAYRIKTILEKDGWKVTAYGNAASFKYQNTMVYYKPNQEDVGKAVAETLKNADRQTALHESSTLKKYDVLVIVGKK